MLENLFFFFDVVTCAQRCFNYLMKPQPANEENHKLYVTFCYITRQEIEKDWSSEQEGALSSDQQRGSYGSSSLRAPIELSRRRVSGC